MARRDRWSATTRVGQASAARRRDGDAQGPGAAGPALLADRRRGGPRWNCSGSGRATTVRKSRPDQGGTAGRGSTASNPREQREGFLRNGARAARTWSAAAATRLPRADWLCSHCPYDQACRRTHPPTKEREDQRPRNTGLHALRKKNKTQVAAAWAICTRTSGRAAEVRRAPHEGRASRRRAPAGGRRPISGRTW